MSLEKPLCLLLITLLAIIASTTSDPLPGSKKTETIEKAKSNTRHDHSSGSNSNVCQYTKGSWSECNPASNTRSRVLTLKKGQDESKCEKTKKIEKKCKKSKSCKYERGSWSRCNSTNEMTRTDVLKNPRDSDSTCEKSKIITKTCNKADRPGKGQKRKHKQQDQQNGKNKNNQN